MKKILFAALLVIVLVLGLSGCFITVGTQPKDKDKYIMGNGSTDSAVENLEIEWETGEVKIVLGGGSSVIFEETYPGRITDEKKMHWYLDGTTLKIRCDMADIPGINVDKTLTVTLPEDLRLKDLSIAASAASVNAAEVSCDTAEISTASGDAVVYFRDALSQGLFSTASGDLQADFFGPVDKLGIAAASGDIRVSVMARVKDVDISTASGEVTAEFAETPEDTEIETSSGSVNLTLPADADLSMDIDSASGDFDSEIPFAKSGDKYLSGSGKNEMSIDTASGDIIIRKR